MGRRRLRGRGRGAAVLREERGSLVGVRVRAAGRDAASAQIFREASQLRLPRQPRIDHRGAHAQRGTAMTTLRILGIDPGLQTTGFGVVDVTGHTLAYVASGTISTTHLDRGILPARLKVLFDGIAEVKERYRPDVAAVEIVFVNVNPQATLLLGQARGACVTALVSCDLAVAEYTALQMKP